MVEKLVDPRGTLMGTLSSAAVVTAAVRCEKRFEGSYGVSLRHFRDHRTKPMPRIVHATPATT
jgi:hypothetical protein